MDLYTISVILFFTILGIVIYKDRKNIDFKYILFMRRTKRFRNDIDKIASISPRFWKAVGTIAFFVAIFFMVYGAYTMVNLAYLAYIGALGNQPAIAIALPIPSTQGIVGPGFIGIPFWFWIIAVSIILIPHEAMHGIIARASKVKLKDVGLMLLAIFPGAFVEPDEKEIKKSSLMTKLRIFSVGSFINIAIGFLVIILVQGLLWAPNVDGIIITNVTDGSPAQQAGFQPGMVLQKIGGASTDITFYDYALVSLTNPNSSTMDIRSSLSSLVLFNRLLQYKPGDSVQVQVDGSYYNITLAEHPDIPNFAYIGIGSMTHVKDPGLFVVAFPLFGIIALLSILVGIFNILPIYPLDGGLIVNALAEKVSKKRSQQITMAITIFMVLIILFTIVWQTVL